MAKNIDNWEFEFHKIFHNPQTLPLLEHFAKQNLNHENIQFLKYWDTFSKTITIGDLKTLVEQATYVSSNFVAVDGEYELNLSATMRSTAKALLDTLIENKYDNEHTLRQQLRSKFEDIAASCISLLTNVFSCFKRSEAFAKFVNQANDATLKQLGTHKRDLEMVLLNSIDVERTYFTAKDVQFAHFILQDYYNTWKLISKNKNGDVLTFCSSHNWVAEDFAKKYGYFKTLKLDMLVPNITPKELVSIEWSKEYHPRVAFNMKNLTCLEFIKSNTYKDQVFSNVVTTENSYTQGLLGNFISPREYLTVNTLIQEDENTYMMIMKPCLSDKLPKEVPKGMVRGGLVWSVIRSTYDPSINATRRTMVVLINPMGQMQVKKIDENFSFLAKNMYKKMGLGFKQRYTAIIEEYHKKKPKLTPTDVMQCLAESEAILAAKQNSPVLQNRKQSAEQVAVAIQLKEQ